MFGSGVEEAGDDERKDNQYLEWAKGKRIGSGPKVSGGLGVS